MSVSSTLVGLILVTRHGDRSGFFQSPTSYAATDTTITPLGSLQEYQSGLGLQRRYLNTSSDSQDSLNGISWPVPSLPQLDVQADASEGQVIVDSAYAFMQGFFPPSSMSSTMLANGTNVTSPLGGYTYIPITTVEVDEDFALEGFTSCPAFTAHTKQVYSSPAFIAKGKEAAPFLDSLEPVLGNRSRSFESMWNIFDYINVQRIHNKTFYEDTSTADQLNQARTYADYHEHAVFTDASPDGIGNIAGRSLLGPLLEGLDEIVNTTSQRKLTYLGCAYKPIMSLLNLTSSDFTAVPDYASALALEIRNSSTGDLTVQMKFRSGPPTTLDGSDLLPTQMWSKDIVTLSEFKANLEPHAVSTRAKWCQVCQSNSEECNDIDAGDGTGNFASVTRTYGRQRVSPVVAGIIGALVALAVALVAFVLFETFHRRGRHGSSSGAKKRIGTGISGAHERTESTHELSHRQSYELDSKAPSLNTSS